MIEHELIELSDMIHFFRSNIQSNFTNFPQFTFSDINYKIMDIYISFIWRS